MMAEPVWDKIYKDYRDGGTAWATLDDEMEPTFWEFVEKTKFPRKSGFDVGFGTGRYVAGLRKLGFEVCGIDNSQNAFEIAKKNLGSSDGIEVADMYAYKLPIDKYGLIYSISTIHHGIKPEVEDVLKRIYKALVNDGFVYITLPINNSRNNWTTFKDKTKIAEGTYAPNSGPEQGLPHSFYTEDEVKELFRAYRKLDYHLDERGRWIVIAQK